MSIARMVTRDATRKQKPAIVVQGDLRPEQFEALLTAAAESEQENEKTVTQALEVLSEYIPTEVVAIYVFGLSLMATVSNEFDGKTAWYALYFLCIALCFAFTFLAWRTAQQKVPDMTFPIWPLIAAVVSFMVWSLAIPGNFLANTPATSALAGFAALVSSFLLRGVENAFFPKKPAPKK